MHIPISSSVDELWPDWPTPFPCGIPGGALQAPGALQKLGGRCPVGNITGPGMDIPSTP